MPTIERVCSYKKAVELPFDYQIEAELFEMNEEDHIVLEKKDLAWVIS